MRDRYVGRWWLASDEVPHVAGELRLNGDGQAQLELHEWLTAGPTVVNDLGTVLGTSLEGELVTRSGLRERLRLRYGDGCRTVSAFLRDHGWANKHVNLRDAVLGFRSALAAG